MTQQAIEAVEPFLAARGTVLMMVNDAAITGKIPEYRDCLVKAYRALGKGQPQVDETAAQRLAYAMVDQYDREPIDEVRIKMMDARRTVDDVMGLVKGKASPAVVTAVRETITGALTTLYACQLVVDGKGHDFVGAVDAAAMDMGADLRDKFFPSQRPN